MQFDDPAKVVADYHASHSQAGTFTEQQVDYTKTLVDDTLAQRGEQAAKGADPFARAVANFKTEVATVGNIHQEQPKFDVEAAKAQADAAPSPDFDSGSLETELGLTPGAMEKLQIRDAETALDATRGIASATANAATDEDVANLMDGMAGNEQAAPVLDALWTRTLAEIDKWQSPKFGVTGNRNSEQAVAAHQLVQHALRQSLGLAKSNLKNCAIETLLKRARLVHDSDYRPAKPNVSRPQQKENTGFRSIHHALLNNPF